MHNESYTKMNDSNDDSVSIVDEKKQMEEFLQVRDYFSQCDPNQIVSFSQIGNIKLDEQFEQSAIVTLTNKILSIAMEENVDRLMIINGVDCYSVFECTNNRQNRTYTPTILKSVINRDYKMTEAILKRIQIMAQMNVFHKNKHCNGRLLITHKQFRKLAFIFTCPTTIHFEKPYKTQSLLLIFLNDRNMDATKLNSRSNDEQQESTMLIKGLHFQTEANSKNS